jgi:HlyD family secretion protein
MKRRLRFILPALAVVVVVLLFVTRLRHAPLVLTGIVTTDEVTLSSQIQGRLERLLVKQGDVVKRGQLLAVVAPAEWQADLAYYENGARNAASVIAQAEADLKYQEGMTDNQIKQAEANLAATESLATQAEAELDIARRNFERAENLRQTGANSVQDYDQARSAFDGATARVTSVRKQAVAAQSAVELAKAGASQVAVRRAALVSAREQFGAATALKDKAGVQLGYTEIHAPADGIVDVRAALAGEVVNPGQAILTLIDPDDLWIRADVEETYIDRLHIGDTLTVRLPSGAERTGTVFFRGIDADFATQRDVSRTKRDIKTFEFRLRCDNRDRGFAVGMTAYILAPFSP